MHNGTTVIVPGRPLCDICAQTGLKTRAFYDGATREGPWAYMCGTHFAEHGVGLGTGRGQRLIVK
jgi:hypothetical protein